MAEQLALLTEPRYRATDPPTSRAAAQQLSDPAGLLAAILLAYADHGPLTDEELAERIPKRLYASVVSARSRLKKHGLVVPAGGTRPNSRGREMAVWTLSPREA